MRTMTSWLAGVITATAVSSGVVLAMLWSYTRAGGWVVEVTSYSVVFPLVTLLAVFQAAASTVAVAIRRATGVPAPLSVPLLAAGLMFGYISALILLANPTGRGYAESLVYAGTEIIALVAACGAGGAVAGLVLSCGRPKTTVTEDVQPTDNGSSTPPAEGGRRKCCLIPAILIRWGRRKREV